MDRRDVATPGQGSTVQLLLWFIFVVSVLTVAARLGTKYAMTRKLGWDDYIMVAAQVSLGTYGRQDQHLTPNRLHTLLSVSQYP